MKATAIVILLLLTASASASEPAQHPVTVELGPKAYRDGDVIQILEVTSTSPRLEQGDTITVRGKAGLDSQSEARLCLFLTQTEGNGAEEVEPAQQVVVPNGLSEFELTITVKHRGLLHLTFYDPQKGTPFGGVYFGTRKQMQPLSSTLVKHYCN